MLESKKKFWFQTSRASRILMPKLQLLRLNWSSIGNRICSLPRSRNGCGRLYLWKKVIGCFGVAVKDASASSINPYWWVEIEESFLPLSRICSLSGVNHLRVLTLVKKKVMNWSCSPRIWHHRWTHKWYHEGWKAQSNKGLEMVESGDH